MNAKRRVPSQDLGERSPKLTCYPRVVVPAHNALFSIWGAKVLSSSRTIRAAFTTLALSPYPPIPIARTGQRVPLRLFDWTAGRQIANSPVGEAANSSFGGLHHSLRIVAALAEDEPIAIGDALRDVLGKIIPGHDLAMRVSAIPPPRCQSQERATHRALRLRSR